MGCHGPHGTIPSMPADIVVPDGLFAFTRAAGKGNDGFGTVPTGIRPGTGSVALTTADLSKAYVADLGPGNGSNTRVLAIVPKITAPAGGSFTVTVKINGHDDVSNQVLVQRTLLVEFDGPPPPPPQATEMGIFSLNSNAENGFGTDVLANKPPDPGTGFFTF